LLYLPKILDDVNKNNQLDEKEKIKLRRKMHNEKVDLIKEKVVIIYN